MFPISQPNFTYLPETQPEPKLCKLKRITRNFPLVNFVQQSNNHIAASFLNPLSISLPIWISFHRTLSFDRATLNLVDLPAAFLRVLSVGSSTFSSPKSSSPIDFSKTLKILHFTGSYFIVGHDQGSSK
ncbi:unnamed protein product [Lactuca virosa]|uniref:Uncharacterized protein n=1 Tax=Lactuca virosa TaxID=75947 RepID=A0AAU9NPS8_9ASTR|nr:unnamed protein product [Lactuca virosa]